MNELLLHVISSFPFFTKCIYLIWTVVFAETHQTTKRRGRITFNYKYFQNFFSLNFSFICNFMLKYLKKIYF